MVANSNRMPRIILWEGGVWEGLGEFWGGGQLIEGGKRMRCTTPPFEGGGELEGVGVDAGRKLGESEA